MTSHAVGAEVYYKLRATAVRSSTFAPNFHVVKPIFVIKAFSYESLEYNQSLEVEVRVLTSWNLIHLLFEAKPRNLEHLAGEDHVQHHDSTQSLRSRRRGSSALTIHPHSQGRICAFRKYGADGICPCEVAQDRDE